MLDASDDRDSRAAERVRGELAALRDDAASAPEAPAAVTGRIVSALRAAPSAGDRGASRRVRMSAVVGMLAAVAAIAMGAVMIVRPDTRPKQAIGPAPDPSATIPLSTDEIVALLTQTPRLGPLVDPRRRSSCLAGLGYPASTELLGGVAVDLGGQPGVLLVLPGDPPGDLIVLAVRPNCSSADTGLLADTQTPLP